MKSNKGQNAIEYILLVTCVIALLIVFLAPSGKMFNAIGSGVNAAVDQIYVMADKTDFSKGYFCGDGSCCNNPVYCPDIETMSNCCMDCARCGDGVCSSCESSASCPADCGTPPPVNCLNIANRSDCCSHPECLWKEYYHLNSVVEFCISANNAVSACDTYNLNSCCCIQEVGYSGGATVPQCAQ